jgi:hypothetical protein
MKRGILRLMPFPVTAIVFVVSFLNRTAFADHGGSNSFDRSPTFRLMMQHRYEDAEKAFTRDISATWRDPDAAFCYGETLLRLGKTSDAIKIWERIIRQFPRSERAEDARSFILAATGQSALKSDDDIGILGFKCKIRSGELPELEIVFPDTPAEKSRLLVRDLITVIDDMPTSKITAPREIIEILSGRPGTRVTLSIRRGNKTFRTVLTRMHSKAFSRAHPDLWKLYLAPDPHSTEL